MNCPFETSSPMDKVFAQVIDTGKSQTEGLGIGIDSNMMFLTDVGHSNDVVGLPLLKRIRF